MRVCLVLLAGSISLAGAQPSGAPAPIEIYRSAVADYIRTGDPSAAAPLLGLSREHLEGAVKIVIGRADSAELEQAAALHLDIGVATVGLALESAAAHFDLGSRLIDRLLPPAEIRRGLSAERLQEIATVRATWHVVAASALLSVNEVDRARPWAEKAERLAPKMAAALTVLGMADEIRAGWSNPEDWNEPAMKNRHERQRGTYLLSAERSYSRAVDADPSYALARIRLGRVQFLLNYRERARKSLASGQAAARDASHQFLAAMFMGALQQFDNDLDGARHSFERALAIAPQSQNAVAALAYVELLSGRPDRAQAVARGYTSAKLDPGWWAFKTGALDQDRLEWLRQRARR